MITKNPPVRLGVIPGDEEGIACYNTDIPYFKFGKRQEKAILFGSGSITNAHCSRELHVSKGLLVDKY